MEHTEFIGEVMADQKLKAGRVYRMNREDGSTEEFLCWATIDRNGTRHAWIQRFGFARQMVSEGAEILNSMEVVEEPKPAPKAAPKKAPAKKTAAKKTPPKARK